MQATNGFFYVLDREKGALISARPVTRSIGTAIDSSGRPIETMHPAAQRREIVNAFTEGAHIGTPCRSIRTGLVTLDSQ